jgi:hypothetical protein
LISAKDGAEKERFKVRRRMIRLNIFMHRVYSCFSGKPMAEKYFITSCISGNLCGRGNYEQSSEWSG